MNRRIPRLLALAGAALVASATAADAGTSWRIVASPSPAGSNYSQLTSTAVTGTGNAWAAGFARVGNNPYRALVEQWNGSAWTIVPSAPVSRSHTTFLYGLAATGSTDVWAVGNDSGSSFIPRSLIEHWNGSSWTSAASPAGEPPGATLIAVSADSPSDVWAVGSAHSPSAFTSTPLIEHWNGTSWSVVNGASGYPLSSFDRLEAVAAVAPNDVWALGVTGRHPDPVFEHFNGSAWSIVPQPANGYDTFLDSIVAVSAHDIWAVGGTSVTDTLVEHWNGIAWSIVPSPNVSGQGSVLNSLSGVTALGPSNVWAVGTTLTNGSAQSTLTEHWNGSSWTIVPSPSPSSAGLNAVSGLPAGPLFAAGSGSNSAGVVAPLVLQR